MRHCAKRIASMSVTDAILRGSIWYRSEVGKLVHSLCRKKPSQHIPAKTAVEVLTLHGDVMFVLEAYLSAYKAYICASRYSPVDEELEEDIQNARLAVQSTSAWEPRGPNTAATSIHEALVARRKRTLDACLSTRLAVIDRFQALCVLERSEDALKSVREHIVEEGELAFTPGSWFFITEDLGDSTEFWETLLSASANVTNLSLPSCWAVESTSFPKGARFRHHRMSRRARTAIIMMHLARSADEPDLIEKVVHAYPEWEEPKVLVQWRSSTGHFPSWRELAKVRERTQHGAF